MGERQQRKEQLGHAIGFLEMRISREDEALDPNLGIFPKASRHGLRIADERRAAAAAHEADAGPEVGTDLEPAAADAVVQPRHALLADRIETGEGLLRGRDLLVA